MKFKITLILLVVILLLVIFYLINNQYKLKQELSNAYYVETRLKEDNEILLRLIALKEYYYNDFGKINDGDNTIYSLAVPRPNIGPITLYESIFYFSRDSILREIRKYRSNENSDSVLKVINEKYPR